jgi:cytoskeletal protein CcmA (bactofilin family)
MVAARRTGTWGRSVAGNQGVLVIREDTIVKGEIRNCRQMEVYGYVEGDVASETLLVHPGGQCYGTIKTDSAEIRGTLQGDVAVTNLISIRDTGSVSGNVRYGQLAMEAGGSLSGELRNVPPRIAGDLDLAVERGRSVHISLEDLHAVDPDDEAKHLTFTVSNARNGFVTLAGAAGRPASRFTQADLAGGRVAFTHDGSATSQASFDISVTDQSGASSGAPRTVKVAVRGA